MSAPNLEHEGQSVNNVADLESLATALAVDDDHAIKKPVARCWIVLFFLIGAASAISVFAVLTVQYWRDNDALQAAQTRNYRDALQQSLSNMEILEHTIRSTLHGAAPVSKKEFSAITFDIKRFFPGVQLVSWIPRIKVRDIPAAEQAAAADGLTGFRITNSDGTIPAATLRPDDDIFPIYYRITDLGFHDFEMPPVGLNVASAPGRRHVLDRACADGDVQAGVFPTTLSLTPGLGSLFLYLAVYDADLTTTSPYQACSRLIGYVGAALRLDVLISTSFRSLPPIAANITLVDVAATPERQTVGSYPAARSPAAVTPWSLLPVWSPDLRSEWLELGGREFALVFAPLPRPWTELSSPIAWLMLVSGLILTTALTAFFVKQRWTTGHLTAEVRRRRQAEQTLRASEYRFRMALRDSNVAVFSQDRDLRYTWVYNPHIGIDAKDMIGKHHKDLFPVDLNHEMEAAKQSVIDTGVGLRRELQLFIGDRRYVRDLRIEPLRDRSGAVTGIICVSIDVTEARRLEEKLSQALTQAECANAAKSRFLAAASHDLRQPLQAMQLYQELLSLRLTDPRHQELCQHMGESIRTGQELLSAMLDVSVLSAGTITPKITSFPLQPSLIRLMAEFQEQAANHNIALLLVETKAVAKTDRVLLERILRNLLTNAIRYTPEGCIMVGCRRRRTGIEIQVYDTGVGIAEDKHALIFEDFYQVGNPERNQAHGLGLGLGIVARTARLLGHRLAMRSVPGRGSMFSITVPAATGAETEPDAKITAARSASDRRTTGPLPAQRILVIEDDGNQRQALRLLLEHAGHTVLDAASPLHACEQVAAGEVPTLIISDLRLPGPSDGIATITELRRQIGRRIPALLVTADTDRERLHEAAATGLTILHKPFNHAILLDALSTILAGCGARRP